MDSPNNPKNVASNPVTAHPNHRRATGPLPASHRLLPDPPLPPLANTASTFPPVSNSTPHLIRCHPSFCCPHPRAPGSQPSKPVYSGVAASPPSSRPSHRLQPRRRAMSRLQLASGAPRLLSHSRRRSTVPRPSIVPRGSFRFPLSRSLPVDKERNV